LTNIDKHCQTLSLLTNIIIFAGKITKEQCHNTNKRTMSQH